MEAYFSNLFEGRPYERSLTLLVPLTDPDKIKQSKNIDDETSIEKKSCT